MCHRYLTELIIVMHELMGLLLFCVHCILNVVTHEIMKMNESLYFYSQHLPNISFICHNIYFSTYLVYSIFTAKVL